MTKVAIAIETNMNLKTHQSGEFDRSLKRLVRHGDDDGIVRVDGFPPSDEWSTEDFEDAFRTFFVEGYRAAFALHGMPKRRRG